MIAGGSEARKNPGEFQVVGSSDRSNGDATPGETGPAT